MVSWNDDPSVQYDLWYGPISNPEACQSTNGGVPAGCQMVSNVASPYAASALINGVSYSFVMNGRNNKGKAGSNTPIASATPGLAGANWQPGASLGNTDMHGVTYGGFTINTVNASGAPIGYYVTVGNGGALFKGTDGVTWTAIPSPTGSNLNAVLFAQSYFIAAGASGSIFFSLDTVSWTAATSGTSQMLNALASNASLARCYGVLVGPVTTADYFTTPNGCGFWGSKANNAGLIVAVGDSGTILYSSNGGQTWTAATSSSIATTQSLHGVAYFPTTATWYAVGAGGTLLSSTNASNWTPVASGTSADLNGIAVLASTNSATLATTYTIVAVGSGGTILTSNDGTTWTSKTISPSDLYAVTGWSQFVAVGAAGSVFTSPDGATWTQVTNSGTSATLYSVLGEAGQYNALGQGGSNIFSQ